MHAISFNPYIDSPARAVILIFLTNRCRRYLILASSKHHQFYHLQWHKQWDLIRLPARKWSRLVESTLSIWEMVLIFLWPQMLGLNREHSIMFLHKIVIFRKINYLTEIRYLRSTLAIRHKVRWQESSQDMLFLRTISTFRFRDHPSNSNLIRQNQNYRDLSLVNR